MSPGFAHRITIPGAIQGERFAESHHSSYTVLFTLLLICRVLPLSRLIIRVCQGPTRRPAPRLAFTEMTASHEPGNGRQDIAQAEADKTTSLHNTSSFTRTLLATAPALLATAFGAGMADVADNPFSPAWLARHSTYSAIPHLFSKLRC